MADTGGAPPRRVAWVTGGSRGVGRGVAVALGQAGWVVYVTARSSADGRTGHLPGTVEQTADAVTAAGGHGVAVPCDHRDDAAVKAVAARIAADHGRLDLLVNNAWAGYERLNAGAWEEWNAPLWQQPLELFDAMFGGGVRTHYVATAVCAPLLIATPHSLVVTVSVAVPETEQHAYGAAYAMAKTADDRLALAAAIQLGEHRGRHAVRGPGGPVRVAIPGGSGTGHRRAGRGPGGAEPDRPGTGHQGARGALRRRRVQLRRVEGRGPDVQEGADQGVLVVEGRGARRREVVEALAEPGQRGGGGGDVLAGQPLPGARVGVDLSHRGVGEGLHLLHPQRLQARVGAPVLHDGAQDGRARLPQLGPGGDPGAQRGRRVGRAGQ